MVHQGGNEIRKTHEKTDREFVSLVSDFCGVCRRTKEGSVLKEWVNGDIY